MINDVDYSHYMLSYGIDENAVLLYSGATLRVPAHSVAESLYHAKIDYAESTQSHQRGVYLDPLYIVVELAIGDIVTARPFYLLDVEGTKHYQFELSLKNYKMTPIVLNNVHPHETRICRAFVYNTRQSGIDDVILIDRLNDPYIKPFIIL